MPMSAPVLCTRPTPARLAQLGKTEEQARHAYYCSARWQKLRRMQLAREPFCRKCGRPATDADHEIPRPLGPDSLENLRSLCHSCHSAKTQEDQHG
jgi:5-methylcytosine-specific restriction endonuclease McrA